MGRFTIVIAALYSLALIANAVPQTYDIPDSFFGVSFDMNTSEKLGVTINPTGNYRTRDNTMYSLNSIDIIGENGDIAVIYFIVYSSVTGMDMSDMNGRIVEHFRGFYCRNVDVDEKFKIDGTTGLLVSGGACRTPSAEGFIAYYNPNLMADPNNSINCIIKSTFPWDKGTRDLLNTIQIDVQHITKRIRPSDCCVT